MVLAVQRLVGDTLDSPINDTFLSLIVESRTPRCAVSTVTKLHAKFIGCVIFRVRTPHSQDIHENPMGFPPDRQSSSIQRHQAPDQQTLRFLVLCFFLELCQGCRGPAEFSSRLCGRGRRVHAYASAARHCRGFLPSQADGRIQVQCCSYSCVGPWNRWPRNQIWAVTLHRQRGLPPGGMGIPPDIRRHARSLTILLNI